MATGTLAMLSLAARADARFAVDDREIERKGILWTLDTVEGLGGTSLRAR
jgi:nicotinic acid mononucleotide adenylyltransferase